MSSRSIRGTLLNIPLMEEKYGLALLASIGLHAAMTLFLVLVPFLLPRAVPVPLGGPGGGTGGEVFTVGVADELAGGTGMTKPSLVPQPPPLPEERTEKTQPKPEAIALPQTIEKKPPRKVQQKPAQASSQKVPEAKQSNVIPTAPEAGAGGTGGIAGGSGGGRGGGAGVSIGAGSGGLGDSWYARVVESRISTNWIRPPEGVRCDIVYSFYIALNGSIYNIKLEKSSGNAELDMTAERAIRASNPLAPPPPEFRGREIQFVAEFIYPPNPLQ